ncbi:VPA1269 family protein [Bradyrhizobium sp.]|uniref:VPA1269 family protein n=1 Tax=Bradyrhizobium sp. TaxID=376 RepID=UPI002727E91B|nr:VPA1269 family protein [Bradyrhizobium sp.]MDO9294354.1 VPA1269 family protein [Bradyrhizobium sp.]
MSEFTVVADSKINGAWFNRSLTHFALVPDTPGQDLEATAVVVDELVRRYRAAPQGKDVNTEPVREVVAELYDLHAQQLILWPVGVQFNKSVLGKGRSLIFFGSIEEIDPPMFALRDSIEGTAAFENCGYPDTIRQDRSSELWRVFMTVRLATLGLKDFANLGQEHVFAVVAALQIDGVWAGWTAQSNRRSLTRFTRFMAALSGNQMYGASILNPARRIKAGPRVPPIVLSHPHLAWIEEAFETWLDESVIKTKKNARYASRLLTDHLRTLPPEETVPERVFGRARIRELVEFGRTWRKPISRGLSMAKLMDFAEWYCHGHAQGKGETVKLEWTRFDVEQFIKAIPRATSGSGEVAARPMPTRYHRLLRQIITENDFAWPKSVINNVGGVPAYWVSWTNPETQKIERVFCEVVPRLLLLLLELPLRNIQARRLDSGEGDEREYDPVSRTWKDATGPLAGYWRSNKAVNARRGVLREIATEIGTITGFWINSNKTQDRASLFDETSGYEIPWQHEELIDNLVAMRRWQEKYNPVSGPLEYEAVSPAVFKGEEPSRSVRAVLPARFYLFRYPLNVDHHRAREAPPSYFVVWSFFLEALDEMERRLREEDPAGAVRIITERNHSGQPTAAIFTMHGMRSSTLTALHLAGVPIGVLSKLVAGHATILMTLRYTKFDPAHVNQILNDARTKVMLESKDRFTNFLKSATIAEAMRMSARLSDDGLGQMKGPSYGEPTGWSRFDLGICPNGGTLCHVGGEIVHTKKEKNGRDRSTYKEVSGGPRNCVRCRFFVTGLPFMIPLWAHASAIFVKVDSLSKRIDEVTAESEALKAERRSLALEAPRSLTDRIVVLDEMLASDGDARDQALADVHATVFLLEKIRTIIASGDPDGEVKLPMLLGEDGVPQFAVRESTRFEIVDAVVQASRWFPSLASADLEAERDEFLNKALYSNGYVPITLSPLTAAERRKAADALAQMLLVELGAAEAQNVIEGRKSLADLGLQDKLETVAAAAVGRPIERLSLPRPAALIDIAAE